MNDCLLKDTIQTPCVLNPTYEDYKNNGFETVGCGNSIAILYFISFTMIVSYIFVNLFLAIIIQGFSDSNQQINYKITETDLE